MVDLADKVDVCTKFGTHPMGSRKIISVIFFRSRNGNEPVRKWLLSFSKKDKKIIGEAIKVIELGWPLGMLIARKIDKDLWEVRCTVTGNKRVRVLFTIFGMQMVLLHGFVKKTAKTPISDLDIARRRCNQI